MNILIDPNKDWTKPTAGEIKYVLHQHVDLTWELVRIKANCPNDKEAKRAILQSALDRLAD